MCSSAAAQVGIGWRGPHHAELLQRRPALGFVEVHAENFMADGGAALALLEAGRACYDISLHGVGLGLGSAAGIDAVHLQRLARLAERVQPVRISDHAAFARVTGVPRGLPRGEGGALVHGADLLPIAFTQASLDLLCANVQRAQEALRRPMAVENLSACLRWADDEDAWPEGEFLAALARRSGCQLLLDLNNLVVNALNAGAEPRAWVAGVLDALDADSIAEIHLAGHAHTRWGVIDDHGSAVPDIVWQVYADALARLGPKPTLIEWDHGLPPLQTLLDQAALAAGHLARAVDASVAEAA